MTTPAEPGTMIDGTETIDRQALTTTAPDERIILTNDGLTETLTIREVMDVIGSDPMVVDEQAVISTAVEEAAIMVDVDPLACPLSTSFLSADEAVLSPSSGTPRKSVSAIPLTPRRDFLSAAESTPDASGLGGSTNIEREVSADGDSGMRLRKRIVGRKLAVVEDDEETQTSKSSTSEDEEILTTASSSRTGNRGIKRGRKTEKNKDRKHEKWTEEGSSMERTRKKKGKKKVHERKDTPEELSDGEHGEPKGVVDLVLEDMTSAVLGGAITRWADRVEDIRSKCKNIQGKLSGEIRKCMIRIKDGTALLVARSEASGDPKFLRLRNSELDSRLREVENENVRLKEQLRKLNLGPSPPRRKRRIEKGDSSMDLVQSALVDTTPRKGTVTTPTLVREEFPPLPQRFPRSMRDGNGQMLPSAMTFSTAVCESEGTESAAEAYFTRHINFLTAARDMERKRREQYGKEKMDLEGSRKENRNEGRYKELSGGREKSGPRIVSDIQVAPPFKVRLKEGATTPIVSGSEAEWKMVTGGKRGRGGGKTNDGLVPPPLSSSSASRRDPPALERNMGMRTAGERVARPQPRQQPKVRPPRLPASSAVTITGKTEGFSYATAQIGRAHV